MADEVVVPAADTGAAPATPAAPVQSTEDRALAAWQASDPSKTAAQPMPAAAPAADPNAAPVDPNAQPDPLEGLKENPRVIELLAAEEQHKAFQEALQGLPYTVESPQELKAQLGDASMLYDIVSGKRSPSELLEVMMANNHWTPEQQNKVLTDLAQYISTKTGQPVAAAAAGQKFDDPVQKELSEIKGKLTAREQAEQQAAQQAEQTRVQGTFNKWIDDKCKDFPKDAEYYSHQVVAKIAGNDQILAQVAKGNFAQVNKLFAEARNADVERFKRWSNGLVDKSKAQQAALPRQPNGAVAATTGQPVAFKNDAERQEHMLKILRDPVQ